MSRVAEPLVVSLVAILVLGGALAQEEAPAPAAPIPIALADIPLRSEELTGKLRRVEALLAPRYEIGGIEAAVNEATAVLTELQRELDTIDPDRISARMLEDHRLAWAEFDAQLEDWMEELQERFEDLTQERDTLRRTRLEWDVTRDNAEGESAPAEILVLIATQLEHIDETVASLQKRSDAVGSVLARVSQGREISARSRDRVAEMTRSLRERIWNRDGQPLWQLGAASGGDELRADADQAGRYWLRTLDAFVAARQGRFLFLLAFFILAFLSALMARRRSRAWPADDASLEGARFVVSRPLSTAMAFTVLAMVFVLDNTVGPAQDLVMVLAIVPFVRLGSGLMPDPGPIAVKGAALLLVLNRLWTLVPDDSALRRFLLILVTALALVATAAFLVRWRRAVAAGSSSGSGSGWWRLGWSLIGLAAVLLALSLVASVLGWSNLGQRLTDAVLESAFGALAWMTMVRAIVALVPLAVRGWLGSLLPSLKRYEASSVRTTFVLASLIAFVFWGRSALRRLHLLEPFRERAVTMLTASASVGGLEVSAGRVVAALLILAGTWLLARTIRFLLREEILPRLRLPAGAGHSVISVVNYVIWASGLLLAAAAAGLNATQLTVVFGALGVGIGFGLQNIVGNFVSGLILIFERPINVGDRVQTKDHFGIVSSIGIRASMIRTFEGAEVVVPNSDLVSKEVVNWTRTDMTRRVEVLVHVALGSDPKQVLEILRNTAAAHPKTLDDPAPSALMVGFGESALNFRLLLWCRVEDFLDVSSDLHVAINDELKRAGIEIPYPHRAVRLQSDEGGGPSARAQLETSGRADG